MSATAPRGGRARGSFLSGMPASTDASPALEPVFGDDGTDLSLIRWALSLSPLERLQAFEALMADVVVMLGAANDP